MVILWITIIIGIVIIKVVDTICSHLKDKDKNKNIGE